MTRLPPWMNSRPCSSRVGIRLMPWLSTQGCIFSGYRQGWPSRQAQRRQMAQESVERMKGSLAGHGALIVIERKNSLADYKHTGSVIDAVISPDMLCSIFYKGTALHDGAVIIRDGRIDSAACVLPMTSRVDIDSELGTRHRAAIGTTELTDAVVVVVSEETGNISLSIDGELQRGFTYSSLRAALKDILVPVEKKPKKSRGRAAKNAKSVKNAKPAEKKKPESADGSTQDQP